MHLLDDAMPIVAGSEVHDHPYAPLSRFARDLVASRGDDTPVEWVGREDRYQEKLATPDVTIADILGDLDPIKAARSKLHLADELTIHYGLLPRANRGIFAINELPDLAGKMQVGLFNILQEGDVQIKGYPVRLPLDVMVVARSPFIPGCVVRVRPIAVLLLEDESGGDEKILAVPVDTTFPYYEKVEEADDLPQIVKQQIEHFFTHYKDLEPEKWVRVGTWLGRAEAERIILESIDRAKQAKAAA